MNPLAALARASTGYEQRLAAVEESHGDRASVCEGWTVRDVADHVTGGNRFAVALLAGKSAERAYAAALDPGFDEAPLAAYRASAAAQLDAFGRPGGLERIVTHPAGDLPGRALLALRLGDLLLHGWDLARSTGGDESLDDELVPEVWAAYQPILGKVGKRGLFGPGPSGDVAEGEPLSLRLLDLSGRRP